MRVNYQNIASKDEAFVAVKNAITPETLGKFNVSAEVTDNENLKTIQAIGKGFKLNLVFMDDAVDVNLDLSLFLKPFQSKVLATIESMVKKVV